MALTNEDLKAIADLMDHKLEPINQRLDNMDNRLDNMDNRLDNMDNRLDKMDNRLDNMDNRLDNMDNRLDKMEVWQKKTSEQVAELQVAQKLFELSTNKKLARLQDGMDTVTEILKLNELIPR